MVQLHSAFISQGPQGIRLMKDGLVELLERDGFRSVCEAIGIGVESERAGDTFEGQ